MRSLSMNYKVYFVLKKGKYKKKSQSHNTCSPIMYVRPTAVFTSLTMHWELPETSFCAGLPVEEDTVLIIIPWHAYVVRCDKRTVTYNLHLPNFRLLFDIDRITFSVCRILDQK